MQPAKEKNGTREILANVVPGTGFIISIVPLCKLNNKTNSTTLTRASSTLGARIFFSAMFSSIYNTQRKTERSSAGYINGENFSFRTV